MTAARDPGLQPERTALAWSRTMLLIAANAGLFVRSGLMADDRAVLGFGIALALVGAWVGWLAHRRRFALANAGFYRVTQLSVGLVSAVTALSAVAAAWVIWH